MKRIFNTSLVGWLIVLGMGVCVACSTHDYLRYDASQTDRLYMISQDSTECTFDSYRLLDSMDAKVEIHLLGSPRDYDREIMIEIVDSLTTAEEGLHYRLDDKIILKAGEIVAYIPLIFYRKKDPELYAKRVSVGLRLKENEHFKLVPGVGDAALRVIPVVARAEEPWWWNDEYNNYRYEVYLGPYSETLYKKFLEQYESLETTKPSVYKSIYGYVGYLFSNEDNVPSVFQNYEYPMVKYIVHPLYDYFQNNPHPDVNIPTPKY